MALSGRSDDPKLDQLARDVFEMFPQCHRCGQKVASFEQADVRVHVHRVVHRGHCPPPPLAEHVLVPGEDPG